MRAAIAVIAFVACAHAGLWALTREQVTAPNFYGQLASVSYSPFANVSDPNKGHATAEQIRGDLKAIAPYTKAIRLYSSIGGNELVPGIAAEFGLRVTAGAWLDKDQARNKRELQAAIDLAKRHSNVKSIVVGNETIFRGDLTVPELIKTIQQVKRQSPVPVSTGEIWSVWRDHPELVSAVDYIAVHILPYWEGTPDDAAVDAAIGGYDQLRRMYPGKRIVIAEFGWPSAGYNFKKADPGRLQQAEIIRDFAVRAESYGIDYNIVEAIDQPWKTAEGGVGPYWGLFDASRHPKFEWTGPLTNPEHIKLGGIAVLLGLLLSLPILGMAAVGATQALMLAIAANVVGAWAANMFAFWTGHYFVPGAAFAYGLGVVLLIPLIVIAMARIDEIAAIAFGRKPRRLIDAPPLVPAPQTPKVSIHIPAYRESPEMLKQTLDSVAQLDYPNLECIVIINNTPDPAMWRPIEEHCRLLGDRFKFLNVDGLKGFKAGALRLALQHTAPDVDIIGVIDADYVVHPDWLKDLVPAFDDPSIGLVQAPQDHRDGDRSVLHSALNGEYAGFFDIGMVQRNEYNAIIVHGTMCLVRRAALTAAGGWSSDTICEDTDLGLTILELGWKSLYTRRRYGRGLLPDSFQAYKLQRHRWAYGGFQIIKKHWRFFLPGASRLTRDQKREFLLGWLNWLGAESVGVVVALLNIVWVPFVSFFDIAVPDRVLTLPIMISFLVSLLHFVSLYRLRVSIPARNLFGAVFAAMSVQWTVARAVGQGLVKDHLAFVVTAKGGAKSNARRAADFQATWEAIIAGLLWTGALVLYAFNYKQVREINLFALVLLVQSVPFIAAAGLAWIERSRLNDFAYWHALDTRLAEILPRGAARRIAKPQGSTPVQAPAANTRSEIVP
ncbi:MAG: beta-(1-3)-glucosyl transferase [Pseudolabrys sp.]|jgi:cellulose synthase/poly-beta-1,6-N-acetylglucosamine synthase-like glycosyltransferase/exo-beta-1,3-glucanase (GH17 family)|nr:beta-(1-3)-glucosyl transferase [Pseudolabrys sp.]